MNEKKVFKVGSRKSQLALIQTNLVIDELQKRFPDKKFEIVTMTTTGDQILDKPLPKIGEKSLFTKELETALERNEVDFVVHSLKDLPTLLPIGLTIGAVLEREDPRDAVIVHPNLGYKTLSALPESSIIGTSSLRRTAQLVRNYPHLKIESIRGNLNTRLKKLDEFDKYSAIILAAAGVKRMKWEDRITQYLEPNDVLYAVGQGALAVECRDGDDNVLQILQTLNHKQTILRIVAERSFLKTLDGGCSAPVAVHTTLTDGFLAIEGAVWSLDGQKNIHKMRKIELKEDREPPRKCPYRGPETNSGMTARQPHSGITARNIHIADLDAAEELGIDLALDLIKFGALDVIGEAKLANQKADDAVHLKREKSTASCNNDIQVR